ncbi:hypothetical protein P3W24_06460 [Luteibacter sp. PPL201]|uniref:Uncharacterized protein n=1 Tax=Luteibacter sahnii TaxID=3021977 RepID=A0ABT6B9F5_9GAMM|nr:hypothetical protein [Luteibacter sp. PPL193]MDY1549515.1 hypothetical protein [Luteibacter sp. PPL193]
MDDGLSLVDALREGDHEEARFLSARVLDVAENDGLTEVVSAVRSLHACLEPVAGSANPMQRTLASLTLLGALLRIQYGF